MGNGDGMKIGQTGGTTGGQSVQTERTQGELGDRTVETGGGGVPRKQPPDVPQKPPGLFKKLSHKSETEGDFNSKQVKNQHRKVTLAPGKVLSNKFTDNFQLYTGTQKGEIVANVNHSFIGKFNENEFNTKIGMKFDKLFVDNQNPLNNSTIFLSDSIPENNPFLGKTTTNYDVCNLFYQDYEQNPQSFKIIEGNTTTSLANKKEDLKEGIEKLSKFCNNNNMMYNLSKCMNSRSVESLEYALKERNFGFKFETNTILGNPIPVEGTKQVNYLLQKKTDGSIGLKVEWSAMINSLENKQNHTKMELDKNLSTCKFFVNITIQDTDTNDLSSNQMKGVKIDSISYEYSLKKLHQDE